MLVTGASAAALEALVDVATPCLIVADYAETRAEQLEVLLPLLQTQARAECPVRVLLLVRAAPRRGIDWTQVLRHRTDTLDVLLDDVTQLLLEDAPLQAAERGVLFAAAAAAFAERLDSTTAPRALLTFDDIGEPAFASPLMVVIAAYLAVHGDAGAVPATRFELLDELLAHEQRYWTASAKAAGVDADAVLRTRVVALATLTGATGQRDAVELLAVLDDLRDAPAKDRGRLARWAHDLYPAGEQYWNPLQPDLAGERLVATTYAAEPGSDAAHVLSRVLTRPNADGLIQPLSVLARAAPDHPELARQLQTILSEQLPRLCELAIAQAASETDLELLLGDSTLAAVLQRAVSVVAVNAHVLPNVVDAFPPRADLVLNPLVLALTAQQTMHARQLAQADPATHQPDLAGSLNNLSVRLADAGRRDEALAAIEEAVAVRRRLAGANAAAYEPGVAPSSARNPTLSVCRHSRRVAVSARFLRWLRRPVAAVAGVPRAAAGGAGRSARAS
jgi:Tetratricopeptide repeat